MKKLSLLLVLFLLLQVLLASCGTTSNPTGSSAGLESDHVTEPTTTTTTSGTQTGETTSEVVSDTTKTTGSSTSKTLYDAQTTTKTTTTTSKKVDTVTTTANKKDNLLEYNKYNLKTYMQPVWQGNTMYNEIVMFYPNGTTKKVDPAPLLYTPKKVISVRSFDLKTEYVEGVDYTVKDGCIALTENSRIKAWKYDDYYLSAPSASPEGGLPCISVPGRYFVFGDGVLFAKYQVCVTYTHEDKWTGPIPAYQGAKLPKTAMALAKKQTLNVVVRKNKYSASFSKSELKKIRNFNIRHTFNNMAECICSLITIIRSIRQFSYTEAVSYYKYYSFYVLHFFTSFLKFLLFYPFISFS